MTGSIGLDSCSVDGAPSPLRVIWVERLNELIAWELNTGATVLRIMLIGAEVGRASPPEGFTLYLSASCAAWLPLTYMPFTGTTV